MASIYVFYIASLTLIARPCKAWHMQYTHI